MNKKKNVSEVFAQNGSPGKKKLDIMLLLKIHFISFYAVASPFSLLLYRSVPSKTYTVEQTLDQLRSISINATKKLQCINGGINIRPNSSVRKVALLSSSIFGLAEQAAYCLSLIFESFSWIFSAIYGLFFPLILKNLP